MATTRQRAAKTDNQIASKESCSVPSPNEVTIVMIHGFMSPWYSQVFSSRYLLQNGWPNVEIFNYDSKSETIEIHGETLAKHVANLAKERPTHTFYFCATSMGNLLLRVAFQRPEMPENAKIGRHVAIGPPWRGAAWGRAVSRWPIGRKVAGDGPGRQLLNTKLDGFDYMGNTPEGVQTLVIAGTSSYNCIIPTPNDGTVCLEETILRTPHWRKTISWGVHALLNFTPAVFHAAHQFFLGNTSDFDLHPGLDSVVEDS